MDQINRIKKMEAIMDKSEATLELLRIALQHYEEISDELHELETYYSSEAWRKDFHDDEHNRLPQDLKRGVLSEDGIWNLLEERDHILMKMQQIIQYASDWE